MDDNLNPILHTHTMLYKSQILIYFGNLAYFGWICPDHVPLIKYKVSNFKFQYRFWHWTLSKYFIVLIDSLISKVDI